MSSGKDFPGVIPATGLTVVVPHDNPTLDIVFVHGFTGHPERTWRHKGGNRQSGDDNESLESRSKVSRFNLFSKARRDKDDGFSPVYWPRDLLPEAVPNARILTYGYDTHIRHWSDQPISRNTVRDIAWDFLVTLEAERVEEPTRPLVFVAHSLGGIVVKELLRRSSGCGREKSSLRSIFSSTTSLVFFGTPHGGADPRHFLQHVTELVMRTIGYRVNEEILNTLLPSSERLKELGDEFRRIAHEQNWMIYSFQEGLGVKSLNGRKVVEDSSSCLNFIALETTQHIGLDHGHMCRFPSVDDVEYKKVSAAMKKIIANLSDREVPNATPSLTPAEREKLLGSLRFDQIDARYMDIRSAHTRTCEWLRNKEEYIDWLDPDSISRHHGLLWIKGKPGTGKSTLMKFALSEARQMMQDRIIISFFFNARGEALEKSTVGMYRSLLVQLLESVPGLDSIFNSIQSNMRAKSDQLQWSMELLKVLFQQAIESLNQIGVICFIDALDECDEDQIRDMVSFFERVGGVAGQSNARFQVCFSSRHYPYITVSHGLELVLEGQEGHDDDIANYIDAELKIGHSKLTADIRARLQAKASGVFMWVVLVVSILNKEYDRGRIHALRRRLEEIPASLNDLFRDILTRDMRDRDELILCIQWILFAKRPLRPEELYFAVLAGTDPESLGPWDQEVTDAATIRRFILDSSKGLAETTTSYVPVVQFIHESVRDFLLKGNGLQKIWPDLDDGFYGRSHEMLKISCQQYMTVDVKGYFLLPDQLPDTSTTDAGDIRDVTEEAFPFLEYSVRNILYHADTAEGEGVHQGQFIKKFPLRDWIYFHNVLVGYGARSRRRSPKATMLYLLAERNLAHLVGAHFSTTSPLQSSVERYGNPFFAALATKSTDVIQALIEIGRKSNTGISASFRKLCEEYYESPDKIPALGCDFSLASDPLRRAAKVGHTEIVRLLIAAGDTDPDARDETGSTLLDLAVVDNRLETMELLLGMGIEKSSRDDDGRTSLHKAVISGHLQVVRRLLEADFSKQAQDCEGLTALHYAARWNRREIARLLVESGADKEARDNCSRTPLHWASYRGNTDVALLLIKAGSDKEARGCEGETPLSLAAKQGRIDTLSVLSNELACKEPVDSDGKTPLHWAAYNGHLEAVRILVHGLVNKDAKDKDHRTPLHLAALKGHFNMVRFLINEGANTRIQDSKQQTPLCLAKSQDSQAHQDIVGILS